ncbi:hypothetical protein [uncultured Gammaproteobacteria bacterium]|nr:hypothetical protein [uncultured Gammaproteobacteria bacterium]
MSKSVFFSFKENDREEVLLIKGKAVNSNYCALNFKVQDLLRRWKTEDGSVIKQAITTKIQGTSKTIVFVGKKTHKSYWVPHEVRMTLEQNKPVYAIRLSGIKGVIPKCLSSNRIKVHAWSEEKLQKLANM